RRTTQVQEDERIPLAGHVFRHRASHDAKSNESYRFCHARPLENWLYFTSFPLKLTGKVALITGGRRIGGAIAEELARRGVGIALSYARSRREAELTASRVQAIGTRVEITPADLSVADDCRRLVDGVATAFGRLDILINM